MISRIILSLKKVAGVRSDGRSLGADTAACVDFQGLEFHPRGFQDGGADIPLDTFFGSQTETRQR